MKWPFLTRVATADQTRALDQGATDRYGIPSLILMENAGRATFEAAQQVLDGVAGKKVIVVAGQGNNGGDGFVIARHLQNANALVTILYYGDREKAKGDALINLKIAEKMGIAIEHNRLEKEFWAEITANCDLLIDALLGTGIKGELRDPAKSVIDEINTSTDAIPVIAVDIPSGIDADTGAVLTDAVNADITVTFAVPKIGLLTYPGAAHVGKLIIADISIPEQSIAESDIHTFLLSSDIAQDIAICRYPDSNKGNFGHVAIIAGSVGMTGAATLAAEGALRIGTGLVSVAVPESLNDILEVKLTEAMTIPVPEGNARAFGMASLEKVLAILEKRSAAVIGPGFGRNEDTIAFAHELIKQLDKPAIIDADGLFALSKDLNILKNAKAPIVITPHPGEMAALLGTSVAEVQSNRLGVARSFAAEYGCVVVLKGAATIVADPSGDAFINPTGSPGMATGGTGDVLSGMIGGLLAQGKDGVEAACIAVYLHGRAGEIASCKLSEAAMIAGDLINTLPEAIQEVFAPVVS